MPALVPAEHGVRLRVQVRPGARRTAVLGRRLLPGNQEAVVLAVSARPEAGAANRAVSALLAETWRMPKTGVTVASGAAARTKSVHVQGDPAELMTRLGAWLAALPDG